MTTYCVYHRADFDGKCSAAIVLRKFPDAVLVPYNYGDEFDIERYRDHQVIMVDCSLQPFSQMVELAAICDLTWIDHHKTAIADYQEVQDNQYIKLLRRVWIAKLDSKFAGCELTWKHFFPDEEMPRGVWLLGKYDTWSLDESPDIMPFQYGLRMFDTDPSLSIWSEIFMDDSVLAHHKKVSTILEMGKIVLQYVKQFNEQVCRHSFEVTFDGLRCICLNNPMQNSQVFDSVYDPARHDAMLSYYNAGGKHWTVSLYTTKEGIDVGAVAKARGGGGHLRAAGFQVKELPKELR